MTEKEREAARVTEAHRLSADDGPQFADYPQLYAETFMRNLDRLRADNWPQEMTDKYRAIRFYDQAMKPSHGLMPGTKRKADIVDLFCIFEEIRKEEREKSSKPIAETNADRARKLWSQFTEAIKQPDHDVMKMRKFDFYGRIELELAMAEQRGWDKALAGATFNKRGDAESQS